MSDQRPSYRPFEWLMAICALLFLCTMYGIAKTTSYRSVERLWKEERQAAKAKIKVSIEGHVKRPGSYEVRTGAPLKDLLRKAGVRPLANLRGADLERCLSEGENILIGELEEVTVTVGGAVKETVTKTLPAGSRISDLKKIVEMAPDADLSFVRRKRILKDGERVEIPRRELNKKQLREQAPTEKSALRDLN